MPLAAIDFVSPPDVAGVATAFFNGRIDLDPASSDVANTVINAHTYYTPKEDGLKQLWKAKTLYLFPPRDFLNKEEQPKDMLLYRRVKRARKSAQRIWLEEAIRKYKRQEYEEGLIFLTSTEVALLTTQQLNIDLPVCIMSKKPELYVDEPNLSKLENTRCLGFIFYVPSPYNTEARVREFIDMFSLLGRVYV
jgi:hypothetical protein